MAYENKTCWVWVKLHILHVVVSTQNTAGRQSWNQCPQITLQLYFNLFYLLTDQSLVIITLVIQSLFVSPERQPCLEERIWVPKSERSSKKKEVCNSEKLWGFDPVRLQFQPLLCHTLSMRTLQLLWVSVRIVQNGTDSIYTVRLL